MDRSVVDNNGLEYMHIIIGISFRISLIVELVVQGWPVVREKYV